MQNSLVSICIVLTIFSQPLSSEPYDRSNWKHWTDEDKDCQNTRHEILIKTSKKPVTFNNHTKCIVKNGEWLDPYTETIINHASELDIDHIVPLSEAHKSGGKNWDEEAKKQFSNDPDNLIVTSKTTNRQKSNKTPDAWMPPAINYHCEYATKWKMIKEKYKLSFRKNELNVIKFACR